MYQLLSPKNRFDTSPLQFFNIRWLRENMNLIYKTYSEYKVSNVGRVDSSHLLAKILNSLAVEFDGDLVGYMSDVEKNTRRIAGILGLTTSSTRGDIFTGRQWVFYKGINEIITTSRNNTQVIDLWWDWRSAQPVTVHSHPVTDLTIFDPLVMNTPTLTAEEGYACINIDIPLLAGQYRMYRSNYPEGSVEQYIAQIVAPSMMRSHLDIVLFNKVCAKLGLIAECKVRTNLPFAQPELNMPADRLVDDIIKGLLSVAMTARQTLASIPTALSDSTALQACDRPELMISQQSQWVLHSQSVDKAGLILEIARRRNHFDRLLELIVKMKRDDIRIMQEGWYRNGLSASTARYLSDRWSKVLSRVPSEAFEDASISEYFDLYNEEDERC